MIIRALEASDGARARGVANRGLQHAPSAELHFLHGRSLETLGDHAAARDAYAQARALNPESFAALLRQGAQEEALGMDQACIHSYQQALNIAAQQGALDDGARLAPDASRLIAHASDVLRGARMAAVATALAPIRERFGAEAIQRIERGVAMCLGETATEWAHPLQRPTFMLIPGLEPKPWFERDEFPFLADIEQHTSAIREELLAVLSDDTVLSPYVDLPPEAPAAPVWRELNRSTRWSSYHLFRHGERVDAHAQRCPRTVAALESIPVMRVPEHSPEALFSLLKAGTHIPPHTGVINGRLTVHLPLIVPPDCGALKAGGEARGWVEGTCLVFDDSFVHEAWNNSDQDRAVLIFDIWDPRMSAVEREANAAAVAAIGRFNRKYGGSDPTHEAH
ncbi:MAG: aspartyl/asparaginyl beta-hydroxylase domain-containing protein [Luteimonas sp.]